MPNEGAGNSTSSGDRNDVDAPEPRSKFRMRLHVMFGKRGGPDWISYRVEDDDGHRTSIDVHSCAKVVQPTLDSPARVEMSPLPKCRSAMTGRR